MILFLLHFHFFHLSLSLNLFDGNGIRRYPPASPLPTYLPTYFLLLLLHHSHRFGSVPRQNSAPRDAIASGFMHGVRPV
ncbi:hypothetical protein F4775DRAFT_546999 [Biscogniauxia sp. FL1348]|nr:hypothetical protein F4775DRAFT_546999 [Biscogniauxia sp. FL1348]